MGRVPPWKWVPGKPPEAIATCIRRFQVTHSFACPPRVSRNGGPNGPNGRVGHSIIECMHRSGLDVHCIPSFENGLDSMDFVDANEAIVGMVSAVVGAASADVVTGVTGAAARRCGIFVRMRDCETSCTAMQYGGRASSLAQSIKDCTVARNEDRRMAPLWLLEEAESAESAESAGLSDECPVCVANGQYSIANMRWEWVNDCVSRILKLEWVASVPVLVYSEGGAKVLGKCPCPERGFFSLRYAEHLSNSTGGCGSFTDHSSQISHTSPVDMSEAARIVERVLHPGFIPPLSRIPTTLHSTVLVDLMGEGKWKAYVYRDLRWYSVVVNGDGLPLSVHDLLMDPFENGPDLAMHLKGDSPLLSSVHCIVQKSLYVKKEPSACLVPGSVLEWIGRPLSCDEPLTVFVPIGCRRGWDAWATVPLRGSISADVLCKLAESSSTMECVDGQVTRLVARRGTVYIGKAAVLLDSVLEEGKWTVYRVYL